jgi:hypothetical protein
MTLQSPSILTLNLQGIQTSLASEQPKILSQYRARLADIRDMHRDLPHARNTRGK